MATDSKVPIRLRNCRGERGSCPCGTSFILRQREVDACTARYQPECAVKVITRQLGGGKFGENVGLCVCRLLSDSFSAALLAWPRRTAISLAVATS